MRLLQIHSDGSFSLVEFIGEDIPHYAILSHTWGLDHEEVTFQEMKDGRGHTKEGYRKIRFCGQQAARDSLQYFWVDTCCIDKSSSAELTESINSMFTWYKSAARCYVFLSDLSPHVPLSQGLPRCRWFNRGWTLQELIAPKAVMFYDRAWNYVGDRPELVPLLSEITGIATQSLLGYQFLATTSVAKRMSWASRRTTKRVEDMAYCLLGIFDVNMPLIYGEGMKAFRRLQEEIIKRNNDLSIFAWETSLGNLPVRQPFMSPLAPSPAAFAASMDIEGYADDFAEFSITNKGLLISGDIPLKAVSIDMAGRGSKRLYSISLGTTGVYGGGIYLRKLGPSIFCRDGFLDLAGFHSKVQEIRMYDVSKTYILLDIPPAIQAVYSYREHGIHVPSNEIFDLQLTYPESLWDETDRMFLKPKRYSWMGFPVVLVMKFDVSLTTRIVPLVVLCHNLRSGPVLKTFTQDQYPEEYEVISQAKYRQEGIHVQELDLHARSIRAMGNSLSVKDGLEYHKLAVRLVDDTMATGAGTVRIFTLSFSIDGREMPAPLERPVSETGQSPYAVANFQE